MAYGETLNEQMPVPEGRTSHKDAKNQMKGYLEWCLDNFSLEEITAQMDAISKRKLRSKHFSELGERWLYLKRLQSGLKRTRGIVDSEIERTENYLKEPELEEVKQINVDEENRNSEANRTWWFQ
jgi:hypothetical protein